jgi:hypothetical protein
MKDEHGVTLLESDMQEIQNIVLECESEQCNIANVGRSVSVYIEDRDIATIEALHDLLLDAHGYSLDFITLKRARELTAKMYKAFDSHYAQLKNRINNPTPPIKGDRKKKNKQNEKRGWK